jgi:hypothetical protein
LADAGLGLNSKVAQKEQFQYLLARLQKRKEKKNLKRNIFSK